MSSKKTVKFNIPMFVACVLLCLTLMSLHLMGGIYARYVSVSEGSDSARVAKFGEITLTESGDFNADGELVIIPGSDLTKRAVVSFEGSETSTYVFVSITQTGWSTADNRSFAIVRGGENRLEWSVDPDWTYLPTADGAYVYYRTLAPNTELSDDIIANEGQITVSPDITKEELAGMTGVSIVLQAAAVQAGGFADAAAAWTSVSAH